MRQWIDSFLTWRVKEKGSTENTIAAYGNDLSQFLHYLSSSTSAETWPSVTEADIRGYRDSLEAREYASSTVARKMAAVRSFFHYLLRVDLLDDDPTVQVTVGVPDRPSPDQLSRRAAQHLWDGIPDETPLDLRDRALVALVVKEGFKTSQVVALNLKDVKIQDETGVVRLHGRRGAEGVLTLSTSVAADLVRYVREGLPKLVGDVEETAPTPLFVNARGSRLSRQGLWLIVKNRGEDAGLEQGASPRALRGVGKK